MPDDPEYPVEFTVGETEISLSSFAAWLSANGTPHTDLDADALDAALVVYLAQGIATADADDADEVVEDDDDAIDDDETAEHG